METDLLLERAAHGFSTLQVPERYRQAALAHLSRWLREEEFKEYVPQLESLIGKERWSLLLDSFYQVIPFGTGGRRGPMGIGPNRINAWTIQSSAQGHAQYLLAAYGDEAKARGVVLAYDVREFAEKGIYDESVPNPVQGLTSKALALAAAQVYASNGIRVFLFDDVRSTPELSFAIRHLRAAAGAMFSASHNPPSDSGKKVYDESGGQLIPPHDQALVDEVTQRVKGIRTIPLAQAQERGLLETIGADIDEEYVAAVAALSRSHERGARIAFTPLHGTGLTSAYAVLKRAGFDIAADPSTSNPSGRFEHVTFHIPNPEVERSFDATIPFAVSRKADLILSTDPDADRIGVMAMHKGQWRYLTGNEIGILLTAYGLAKRDRATPAQDCTVVKTMVTSSLIEALAQAEGVRCIGDLLVGFKYVGHAMDELEREGAIDGFLIAAEESHGFLGGNYARDKDAAFAALWICELASELKRDSRTLIDYLDGLYATYGYCESYLTEIRLLGASGVEKISQIQAALRERPVSVIGTFKVLERRDRWQGDPQPHLSETDTSSRNVIRFLLEPPEGIRQLAVTVRPSGTEPKTKVYIEALAQGGGSTSVAQQREAAVRAVHDAERAVMGHCYAVLGVEFPERGYLLFAQLPLDDKMRYFTVEDELAGLAQLPSAEERAQRAAQLLKFLGADPLEKVDAAFKARFGKGVREHLGLPARGA